jgi:hypothetical protein
MCSCDRDRKHRLGHDKKSSLFERGRGNSSAVRSQKAIEQKSNIDRRQRLKLMGSWQNLEFKKYDR